MKKLLLIIFSVTALVSCNEHKTAYVDTTRLIQDYQEMKDMEAKLEEKSTGLRAQLDSVGKSFQAQVMAYQEEALEMSNTEREEAEAKLMQLQQQLQQQQQMKSTQLREESQVIIDTLITKVKDFVKVYGEENGYTYIFGSNETANIMYAKEGLDITEEILAELNAAYKEE